MPNIEDKKFLIDQLKKERMASALEAMLVQFSVLGALAIFNMTGLSAKYAVTTGLVYVFSFLFALLYSIKTLMSNAQKVKKIKKIEQSLE